MSGKLMKNVAILIPTLNPDQRLVNYVRDLISNGFNKILIVNDGSSSEKRAIFEELLSLTTVNTDVTIFEHAINLGKGRALKNGFNYYLSNIKDKYIDCCGVITVDSDGQHHISDVIKLKEAIVGEGGKKLILGCRNFDFDFVPPKSKFGNKLTRKIFKFCFGTDIADTQTGLRGFSNLLLPDLLELYGERFEYETNVLIECVKEKIAIEQITIQTIYENGNEGTHFNPILDSIKIYRLILKRFITYILSSLSAAIIDCILFKMLFILLPFSENINIYMATFGARIVSSFYNYKVNKNIVFKDNSNGKLTLVKYYGLCVLTMAVSGIAVSGIYSLIGRFELLIKCIVDVGLFLINYQVQQKFIFAGDKSK